jgi:arylamine N-acetyltransferase
MDLVEGYLRRLGVSHPGPPSIDALHALHAAHVEHIAYEVIDIHLGRPTSLDRRASVDRFVGRNRGGYCYHLNGGFSLLLESLGYAVRWHRAGVQGASLPEPPGPDLANHLALTVSGLPSVDCPDGVWLVDAGLGDALHLPIPLRAGTYQQGPFSYRLRPSEVEPGGWRLDHDPSGSFIGMDMRMSTTATVDDFTARHHYMSTSPESGFVRTFCVQRRFADGVDVLTGCVYRRSGAQPRTVDRPADWFSLLADVFHLPLTDLSAADRTRLWSGVYAKHEEWLAVRSAS